MKYKIKYKKYFFWSTVTAIGHRLDAAANRMDIFLIDGSILSIGSWSKYTMFLGVDWVLTTKKAMEEQAGQSVDLNIK